MLRISNPLGDIIVHDEVIARLVGFNAMSCYGVAGMAAKNVKDNIIALIKSEDLERGVVIKTEGDTISIWIHIIVIYGVNIPAISESIVHKVKYSLEKATGFVVDDIHVMVDSMKMN